MVLSLAVCCVFKHGVACGLGGLASNTRGHQHTEHAEVD